MRILKTIIRYLIISAGILIPAMVIVGAIYKDRVAGILIDEINRQSQYKISISKSRLSLLKRFPRASFMIYDVVVRGATNLSHNDTIGSAEIVSLDFRLTNLLKKSYTIEWVSISNGIFHLQTDQAGISNIPADRVKKESSSPDFNLNIRNIRINDMTFVYKNELKEAGTLIHILSARVSGAIAGTDIDLKTEGSYEIRTLTLNGISVNSPVRAEMSIDMHKSDSAFTINRGNLALEKMSFSVSGYYQMKTGDTDITIGSENSDIKALSGFVTAKQGSWSSYKPEGSVSATCHLRGTVSRESKLHYEIAFSLSGIKLEIPGTSLRISESSLSGFYTNGEHNDASSSELSIDNFEIFTGFSGVKGSLRLTDFNNPFLSTDLSSTIDLSEINQLLKGDKLSGTAGFLRTSFIFGGTIASFRDIDIKTIAGTMPRGNIWLSSASFSTGNLSFSDITGNIMVAGNLWADSLSMSINGQRILADGEIKNFTRWLEGTADIVEITGSLSSPLFSSENLLGDHGSRGQADTSAFKMPSGYSARINVQAGEFHHKTFTAYDLVGEFRYINNQASLTGINVRTLGGEAEGSIILTEKETGGYITESNLVFRNLDINNAFISFNNFSQDFIKAENLRGNLSGRYDMRMGLNTHFMPDFNSISSEGRFTIDNGELIGFAPIMSMSKFIEISELENIRFSRLENEFFINDGVFAIPQMEINSSAANLGINGMHKFTGDYQYHLKVELSQILSRKAPRKTPNNEFGIVEDDGLGRTSIFLVVGQEEGKSSIKYDTRAARGEVKADLEREKQTLKGILKEELGWYGKDTSVVPATDQKPKFRIIWDETIQPDTILVPDTTDRSGKSNTIRNIFKKIIKG